jgi:hypothetical protein
MVEIIAQQRLDGDVDWHKHSGKCCHGPQLHCTTIGIEIEEGTPVQIVVVKAEDGIEDL